ncbi:hypothetical protein GF314_10575 [bacterium]|nr:hypothetical protein [bacterium]
MMPPGLVAWIVLAVLLFGGGLLAMTAGRWPRRDPAAELAILAAGVILATAFVRHEVLGTGGLTVALVTFLGGVVLLLASGQGGDGGER